MLKKKSRNFYLVKTHPRDFSKTNKHTAKVHFRQIFYVGSLIVLQQRYGKALQFMIKCYNKHICGPLCFIT